MGTIARNGWASLEDIRDILYLTDARLDAIARDVPIRRWCECFDLRARTIFPRPKKSQAGVVGYDGVAAADVAALLIYLERLGYELEPLPLVERLMDVIRSNPYLTNAQLSVLWYERCRHKCEPLVLYLADAARPKLAETRRLRTTTGYTIEVATSADGTPIWLSASAPKYRKRRVSTPETCLQCGYVWTRGDPDSSAAHRREHKKRLSYLDPQPVVELVAAVAAGENTISVDRTSPRWKHREIYRRALAFKREFGYDFVQWQSDKGDDDPGAAGVLFCNAQNVIVGACAFRLREYQGRSWRALQWIWLAPKYRRSGILTTRWFDLRRQFGDFRVEPPVSEAMQAFLKKMGDESLMGAPLSSTLPER
ncbi:hypothetical protein [Hyphomicrobium sp. CS1BSMeth3]|uniref:hypothetical protein n=1 Tax=Hyphomicrobium sp. CS1BSMeth3 TaxID=1892844 RepID=UPI001160D739|nr:hypothetical protein [Hyphomicrobium sp. CS1BSMeth3]